MYFVTFDFYIHTHIAIMSVRLTLRGQEGTDRPPLTIHFYLNLPLPGPCEGKQQHPEIFKNRVF